MSKEIKKLLATEKHIVLIFKDNSVSVYNRYQVVKPALKELLEENEHEVEYKSTTRQLGAEAIKKMANGQKMFINDVYCLYADEKGTYVFGHKKHQKSTKDELRKIAQTYGISIQEKWNTQELGKNVCNELENIKTSTSSLENTNEEHQQWWKTVPKNVRAILLKDIGLSKQEAFKIAQNEYASKEKIIDQIFNLEVVTLNNCELSDISFLSKFEAIDTLELRNNNIDDLRPLRTLYSMVVLTLDNNNVHSLDALKNIEYLRSLELNDNPISFLDGIEWVELYSLSLSNTKFDGLFRQINDRELTALNISNNQALEKEHLKKLETLSLETLFVDSQQKEKFAELFEEIGFDLEVVPYVNTNEVSYILNSLFSKLKRYSFPIIEEEKEQMPKNGIYIFFEEGEKYGNLDRIVRVGTHTGEGELFSRLNQHGSGKKDRSIFRKNIGRCFLNSKKNDYLKVWNYDLTSKENQEKYADQVDASLENDLENQITKYFNENLSFSVFEVNTEKERLFWEEKIIASLAKGYKENAVKSDSWLGNQSPSSIISEMCLWQEEGTDKAPLTEQELEQLTRLIFPNKNENDTPANAVSQEWFDKLEDNIKEKLLCIFFNSDEVSDIIENKKQLDKNILQKIGNLEKLDLDGDGDEELDLSFVKELSNLKSLVIFDFKINDITPLRNLSNLTSLRLEGIHSIKDFTPLIDLKNLQYLSLNHSTMEEFLPLDSFTSLKGLEICYCNCDLSGLNFLDLEYLVIDPNQYKGEYSWMFDEMFDEWGTEIIIDD